MTAITQTPLQQSDISVLKTPLPTLRICYNKNNHKWSQTCGIPSEKHSSWEIGFKIRFHLHKCL